VKFEVETDLRRHTIEIRRSGEGWTATVDGRLMRIDLARMGDRWSMLVERIGGEGGESESGPGTADGQPRRGASHEIAVERSGHGQHIVYVGGHAVPVTVLAPGTRRSDPGGREAGASPIAVVAPMPGRVVRVLVAAGDAVAARQGLVVVEAMKMENELRAPRAGTVAEVRVREGAPVEANVVLVVIT
jgi:biotin carboxyl carrier protein